MAEPDSDRSGLRREKLFRVLHSGKKALSVFDENGDVRRMLEETGYGDNPAVIRVFARIGRAMAEDRFVSGKPAREDLPLEERLYK